MGAETSAFIAVGVMIIGVVIVVAVVAAVVKKRQQRRTNIVVQASHNPDGVDLYSTPTKSSNDVADEFVVVVA
jgi:hypothetical protein